MARGIAFGILGQDVKQEKQQEKQERHRSMNHKKDMSRCNLIIIMIIMPAWFRFQVGEMSVAGYSYRGFFDH